VTDAVTHAPPPVSITETERALAHETLELLGDHPVLWAVVTGTHQYGFTSPDSDIDVRAVFAAPTRLLLGLLPPAAHRDYMGVLHGREVDGLSFELGRFLELVLKHSGNLLEELFSPLVLVDGGRLEAFREAVLACVTRAIQRHYLGFFEACVKKLQKKPPAEVKTALYAARIALSGITLLKEGRVEANLPRLNEAFGLDYIPEWIALKTTEHEPIPDGRLEPMLARLAELRRALHRAGRESSLPDAPAALDRLSDLVVSVRLATL
jgi:predicted nucleotidyltransferase